MSQENLKKLLNLRLSVLPCTSRVSNSIVWGLTAVSRASRYLVSAPLVKTIIMNQLASSLFQEVCLLSLSQIPASIKIPQEA